MKYLTDIGGYAIMVVDLFKKPTKWRIMKNLILKEIDELIFGSLGIIVFISFFIGAVVSIQTAMNLTSDLIPKNLIGFATRQSIILEFAPTFCSVIMAGKVGSFITSNYLVFPKIVAMMLYPFIIAVAMYVGIFGGWFAGVFGGFITSADFVEGVTLDFIPFHVTYSFIKTFVFAFLLATIPSYHGFYMKGGALEVGKASTTSFVWTSVVIIITNYVLTQLLLT